MSSIPPKPEAVADQQIEAAHLREEVARLQAENRELSAKAWLLEQQISEIGPENARLFNAYNAALCEIARLKAPKGRRGAPKKQAGTYEQYLVRETLEEVAASIRNGNRISEEEASLRADARIRKTIAALRDAGLPGPFSGVASFSPDDKKSIYNEFRRGKRKMGLIGTRQTKK